MRAHIARLVVLIAVAIGVTLPDLATCAVSQVTLRAPGGWMRVDRDSTSVTGLRTAEVPEHWDTYAPLALLHHRTDWEPWDMQLSFQRRTSVDGDNRIFAVVKLSGRDRRTANEILLRLADSTAVRFRPESAADVERATDYAMHRGGCAPREHLEAVYVPLSLPLLARIGQARSGSIVMVCESKTFAAELSRDHIRLARASWEQWGQ